MDDYHCHLGLLEGLHSLGLLGCDLLGWHDFFTVDWRKFTGSSSQDCVWNWNDPSSPARRFKYTPGDRDVACFARDWSVIGQWDGRAQHVIGRVTDAVSQRCEHSRSHRV